MSSSAIPILNLKDADAISKICSELDEPVFIQADNKEIVILDAEAYRKQMFMSDVFEKLLESEVDIVAGRTQNARDALREIREELGV